MAVPEKLTGDVRSVHDPAIVKDGDTWYIFSTGWGIPIRRSSDLSHWESVGSVFPDGLPGWVREQVPTCGPRDLRLGADISELDGLWHLYWSIGVFGTTKAVIGHAVNQTLDPGSADYEWVDKGPIAASGDRRPDDGDRPRGRHRRRRPALAGVGLVPAGDHAAAARPRHGQVPPRRPRREPGRRDPFFLGIEGADWSTATAGGTCSCRSGSAAGASTRTTRSTSVGRRITGPYLDAAGTPMIANGGTTLTGSYANVVGPGHGSIIDNGDDLMLATTTTTATTTAPPRCSSARSSGAPTAGQCRPTPASAGDDLDEGDVVGEWRLDGLPRGVGRPTARDVRLTLAQGGTVSPVGPWKIGVGVVLSGRRHRRPTPHLVAVPRPGLVACGRDSRTATIRGLRHGARRLTARRRGR